MMRVRNLAAAACSSVLMIAATGCVSGMRYKMPMPSSLTLGTVREESATLAADRARSAKPAAPTGGPASGRQSPGNGIPNAAEQRSSELVMLR